MKAGAKSKSASAPKGVREVATKYRTARPPARKYAKCRELTGEELGALAEKMIAAKERGDHAERKRIRKALINGFYGEVRA